MSPETYHEDLRTRADLEAALSAVGARGRDYAYFIPILHTKDPWNAFASRSHILQYWREELRVAEWLQAHDYPSPTEQASQSQDETGRLYIAPDPPRLWFAITFDGPRFVQRVEREIKHARRYFPPFDLSLAEMYRILLDLKSALGLDELVSTRAVLRSRTGRASIDHKPQPFEKIFRWAEEREDFISRLQVTGRGSNPVEFMLFRDGRIRLRKAAETPIFHLLMKPVLAVAQERMVAASQRERTSFSQLGRPLEIRYGEGLFRTINDNLSVVTALQKAGHGSLVVHHANPYLHGTFVDLIDGGYVDVVITSQESISLIPGYGAGEGVLLRVLDALSDGLPEGQIVPHPEHRELGIDDIMGGP